MARSTKKLFYKIGEVCEMCAIEPHVLRYWETEFALLSPTKNRSGQRMYREKDLRLIKAIQHLLYEKGYTIAGANRKLREDGTADLPLFESRLKVVQEKAVAEIRSELQKVLDILDHER